MAQNDLDIGVNLADRATPGLKNIESSIIRLVGAVSAAGAAFAAIALPITLAADFQKEMLNVKKTTDFGTEAIESMGRAILGLSRQINVSATDLAKIAELGGQLGIGAKGGAALLSFTEEIARAVTALDVSAEEAGTSLGKLINIFDIDPSKYRNTLSAINEISNVSTAKPSELFDILRRIGNLGGSIDLPEAAALAATMVDLGLTAETAGTSLTKVFANMKADAGDFAKFVGLGTEEWVNLVQKDGVGALNVYLAKLNAMPPAIAAATKVQLTGGGRIFELVTKLQAEQAKLGGGLITARINQSRQEYDKGTSALKEQQNVLSGLSAQWQVLKNNVAATFTSVGQDSLAPLTLAASRLSAAVNNPAFIAGASAGVSTLVTVVDSLASALAAVASLNIDWDPILAASSFAIAIKAVTALQAALGTYAGKIAATVSASATAATANAQLGQSFVAIRAAMQVPIASAERLAQAVAVSSANSALAVKQEEESNFIARERGRQHALLVERELRASMARRRADAYLAANVTPLQTLRDSGATLTASQNRSLGQYRAHYTRLESMAVVHENAVNGNQRQAMAAQAATRDSHYRTQLVQYRTYLDQRLALARSSAIATAQAEAAAQGIGTRGLGIRGLGDAVKQRGVLASLGVGLAHLTGQTAAWAAATTNYQRVTILGWGVVSGVVRGAGVAMKLALGAVSKLFAIGLWASLIAMVLDYLGYLDKAKAGVVSLLKLLGVKPPDILLTEDMKKAAKEQKIAYSELVAAAAKFDAQFGTVEVRTKITADGGVEFNATLDAMKKKLKETQEQAAKKIVFNLDRPADAGNALKESVQIYSSIASKVAALTVQIDKEKEARKALQEAAAAAWRESVKFSNEELLTSTKAQNAVAALGAARQRLADNLQLDAVGKFSKEMDVMTASADRFIRIILSGLGEQQASTFLRGFDIDSRGFLTGLQADTEKVKELSKSIHGLNTTVGSLVIDGEAWDPVNVDGKVLGDLLALEVQLKEVRNRIKENTDAAIRLSGIGDIFPKADDQKAFVTVLAGASKGLVAAGEAAIAAGGGMRVLTEGASKATPPLATTQRELAASVIVADAYADALKNVAVTAKAAADDAANAMSRTVERSKKALRELAAESEGTLRDLRKGSQAAISQLQLRAIDQSGAAREESVARVLSIEQSILNTIKEEGSVSAADLQRRIDALTEAKAAGEAELARKYRAGELDLQQYIQARKELGARVSGEQEVLRTYQERGRMTKGEVAGLSLVNDITKKIGSQKLVDDTATQRGAVAVRDIGIAIREATVRAEGFAAEMRKANEVLNDPNATSSEQAKALEVQADAATKLQLQLKYVGEEKNKVANLEPVAGKKLVPDEEILKLDKWAAGLVKVGLASEELAAKTKEGILQKQAGAAAEQAEAVSRDATAAATKLKESFDGSADAATKMMAEMKQLPAVMKLVAEAASKVGGVADIQADPKAISRLTQQLQQAAIDASKTPINFTFAPVSANALQSLRGSLEAALGDDFFINAAKKLESTPLKVNATLNVTSVTGAALRDLSIAQIPRNAEGGHIQGAGTGKSDSILSWLSHGEYVMDAQSTRVFGPEFFSLLQKLARGSAGAGKLGKMGLQGFANGGLVSSPMTALGSLMGSGVMQAVTSSSEGATGRDIVDVTLRVGGEKLSLFAERQQASRLVSSLRKMEVGT